MIDIYDSLKTSVELGVLIVTPIRAVGSTGALVEVDVKWNLQSL